MKKKYLMPSIILVIMIMLITINKIKTNSKDYYRIVADTIVGFYRDDGYDHKKIKKEDISVIENYLSHLTHNNEEISLEDYMIKNNNYYTTNRNSDGVYLKDGKCYIKYQDIGFDKYQSENIEIEPHRDVFCNNYRITLYLSDFYPDYNDTKTNPRYNYIFIKEDKNMNTYTYWYQSAYDGTYLKVMVIVNNKKIFNIKTEEVYNEV